MTFTNKISGTMVTDFDITPIFHDEFVTLKELDESLDVEQMRWVMDNFFLSQMSEYGVKAKGCHYYLTMDWDTIMKLSVWQNYPEYAKEFQERFGEKWMNYYIRFNH